MPALKYEWSDLTSTDRNNLKSKLREAVREAKKANDELYSLGPMASFNIKEALDKMTESELIENSNKIIEFHNKVKTMLNEINVVLPEKFNKEEFDKEYNKVGKVMSWASSNFDFSNPVLDYIGEEE